MRILVAESDRSVAALLRKALEAESYAVDVVSTGDEALQMLEGVDYDLLILALLLPGLHGLNVLKNLRTQMRPLPVLILARLNTVKDRVTALDLGADDYLTKPFSIQELLARTRALLRRASTSRQVTLSVADLRMDRLAHTVRRNGRRIELTSKEFALLEYLIRNTGRVLTRAMIVEHVWDFSFDTGTNIVDVYIYYLRKKVDQGFDRRLILTVRGIGYQIADSG